MNFLTLGYNGKRILCPREAKKLGHAALNHTPQVALLQNVNDIQATGLGENAADIPEEYPVVTTVT
jgi:hypothetical protein